MTEEAKKTWKDIGKLIAELTLQPAIDNAIGEYEREALKAEIKTYKEALEQIADNDATPMTASKIVARNALARHRPLPRTTGER